VFLVWKEADFTRLLSRIILLKLMSSLFCCPCLGKWCFVLQDLRLQNEQLKWVIKQMREDMQQLLEQRKNVSSSTEVTGPHFAGHNNEERATSKNFQAIVKFGIVFVVHSVHFHWMWWGVLVSHPRAWELSTPTVSNPDGVLSQKLCHCLNQGRTLNDTLSRAAHSVT